MITCSAHSREWDKHNVYTFGVLSERVSECRSRKRDTDIGLNINFYEISAFLDTLIVQNADTGFLSIRSAATFTTRFAFWHADSDF